MCTYGLLQTVCWKGRLSSAASSNEFHGMVGYTHNVHVYIYISCRILFLVIRLLQFYSYVVSSDISKPFFHTLPAACLFLVLLFLLPSRNASDDNPEAPFLFTKSTPAHQAHFINARGIKRHPFGVTFFDFLTPVDRFEITPREIELLFPRSFALIIFLGKDKMYLIGEFRGTWGRRYFGVFGNMIGRSSFNHKGKLHWFLEQMGIGLGQSKRVGKSRNDDAFVFDSGKMKRVRAIQKCLRCKSSSSQRLDVYVKLSQFTSVQCPT